MVEQPPISKVLTPRALTLIGLVHEGNDIMHERNFVAFVKRPPFPMNITDALPAQKFAHLRHDTTLVAFANFVVITKKLTELGKDCINITHTAEVLHVFLRYGILFAVEFNALADLARTDLDLVRFLLLIDIDIGIGILFHDYLVLKIIAQLIQLLLRCLAQAPGTALFTGLGRRRLLPDGRLFLPLLLRGLLFEPISKALIEAEGSQFLLVPPDSLQAHLLILAELIFLFVGHFDYLRSE
mmetsp:Transcript_4521/g.12745  ORF Transcript_4521/g.12745 Transcript_4521/m.12745 type:complete len:241 (+) Transcript_4521:4804-5526(+)